MSRWIVTTFSAGRTGGKSEQLGLVVDLCHGSCHIFGERAAHRCRETAQALHEYGQRLAMEKMGWSTEEFVREFGRNYLDADAETAQNGGSSDPIRRCATPPLGHQGEAENGIGFEVTDFELCVNW